MKSAAEPVGFAVFVGFVMLLPVLGEPVMSRNGATAILVLGRSFGFLAAAVPAVQAFDERGVCFCAVPIFDAVVFVVPWTFAGHAMLLQWSRSNTRKRGASMLAEACILAARPQPPVLALNP
jgi:hypothetical protein